MNNSSHFLEEKINKESTMVQSVNSSLGDKDYLVHKKEDSWFCTCKSFQVRKKCRHLKEVTEPIGEGGKCFYCGTTSYVKALDRNHVDRRGTNPESIMDASNIMLLCRSCHDRATNDKKFEDNINNIFRLINKHETN